MTENTPNSTDESADNQPDIETLAERVNQLEERQQELRQGAVDAQGRNWTLSDLLNLGLTRRQALSAIAALAGGATIGTAMMQAVSPASADPGDSGNTVLGAPDNRWDAWMGEVSIEQASIGANITTESATATVGQSDTVIFTVAESDEIYHILVFGNVQNESNGYNFLDTVKFTPFHSVSVDKYGANAPPTRTYSYSSYDLELSIGSGTADIRLLSTAIGI